MSYCNGKENFYIHADILQVSCMLYCNILVFALSLFSCSRLLLTMAKSRYTAVVCHMFGTTLTPHLSFDEWISGMPNSFRSLCLCDIVNI